MPAPRPRARAARRKGEPLADPVREAYAGQRAMGMGQSAAFRKAKPGAKEATVASAASRLEADPEVRERIGEIQADMLRSSDAYLTKAQLTELLAGAIRHALTDDTIISTAPALVREYSKMYGFYEPERHEMAVGCLDPAERDRKVARLLGLKA